MTKSQKEKMLINQTKNKIIEHNDNNHIINSNRSRKK